MRESAVFDMARLEIFFWHSSLGSTSQPNFYNFNILRRPDSLDHYACP
jgi:hypothetical protein